MALQILPTPPSAGEGYDRLGQALLQGSRDYMNQKLASDHEDKLRQQALADIAAQQQYQQGQIANTRAYNDQRYGIERQDKLSDQQTLAEQQMRQAELRALIPKYLTIDDIHDPAKVAAAYAQARQDGVLTDNAPLIQTGALNAADAADPDARARALNQLGARNLQAASDAEDEKANAAKTITQLEAQKQSLQQRSSELDRSLSTPTPLPTDAEIKAYAQQKAQQFLTASGKTAHFWGGGPAKPTEEQVAAQMDAAKTELTELVKNSDYQRKQNAAIQKELLQNQLRDTQAQQTDLIRTFHVAPSAAAVAAPAAVPTPAPSSTTPVSQASPEQLARVRAQVLSAAAGTPAPSANLVGLRNPTETQPIPTSQITDPNDRAIAEAENQRRAGIAQDTLIAQPIRQAQSALQDIDAQIAQARTIKPPSAPTYMGGYMGGAGSYQAPYDPGAKAVKIASLYQQRAQAQKQLTDLQARLQPAPLPATQPIVINTATNAATFADPVTDDESAMGSKRIAPWNQNQFNVTPAGNPY